MSPADDTVFRLDQVAANLESLEETIIYRLLDRAQFAVNEAVYRPDAVPMPGFAGRSFLEARLGMQEGMDAAFGRFLVPEERPFGAGLPEPARQPPRSANPLPPLDFNLVAQSAAVLRAWLAVVPRICPGGDDGHYGSAVEADVAGLQAVARRVHYGALYVSECKFRERPELFRELAARGDRAAILESLTRPEVEARILDRVREKLDGAQRRVNPLVRRTVEPGLITDFYRDTVIPLTKEGEVAYLLARAALKP